MIEDVLDILKHEEGWSERLYPDPGGSGTCIGYGRNLDKDPLTRQEGEYLLLMGVEQRLEGLLAGIDFWTDLPETARVVLLCMAYQMGVRGTLGFRKTLAYLRAHDWEKAADEMLDSKWAEDPLTKERAWRLSEYIRDLEYEEQD